MSLKYRPEIDGLRALAVTAVVLYHAEFFFRGSQLFMGGFIGVDVFFVISGYLITLLILREMKEGHFRFSNFYERRARRILPALFTVMSASIPFAWLHLLPKAMKEYAASVLSALAFSSNIWFWKEDSYWAEPSALKPFLHTWSLSVEEQFYLLYPIALFLLWKFMRKHMNRFLTGMFLLSLFLAHWGSLKNADAAFYLLPPRGWELLGGALLAKREIDFGRLSHPFLAKIMPALGLLMIAVSFLFFDHRLPHPSLITLVPVAGTMLIIWFCQNKEEWIARFLTWRPLVGVGLISYSFYLWHFPLFVFARIQHDVLSGGVKFGCILLAILLSTASYFLIEKPARNRSQVSSRVFFSILLVVFAVLVFTFSSIYKREGVTSRFSELSKRINLTYWGEDKEQRYHDYATYMGCWVWEGNHSSHPENPFEPCKNQENSSIKKKILVIGDSHAACLIPGLIHRFGREVIAQRTASGCFPSPGGNGHPGYCQAEMKQAFGEMENLNPDVILIAAGWGPSDTLDFKQYLLEKLPGILGTYKSKTILVGPLVRWGAKGLRTTLSEIFYKKGDFPSELEPDPVTFQLDKEVSEIAKQIGIDYLSPVEAFCQNGKCLTQVDSSSDAVTSWDSAHLSQKASQYLIEKNLEKIKAHLS